MLIGSATINPPVEFEKVRLYFGDNGGLCWPDDERYDPAVRMKASEYITLPAKETIRLRRQPEVTFRGTGLMVIVRPLLEGVPSDVSLTNFMVGNCYVLADPYNTTIPVEMFPYLGEGFEGLMLELPTCGIANVMELHFTNHTEERKALVVFVPGVCALRDGSYVAS